MKLIDALNNVDKSESNSADIFWDDFLCACGIYDSIGWIDDTRLKGFWLKVWRCTDTWVGLVSYFLDGDLVAMSTQTARKNDVNIKFLSKAAGERVRDYLLSFLHKEEPTFDILSEEDMLEEIGKGEGVSFSSELIENVVYTVESDIPVKVVGKYGLRYEGDVADWCKVDVMFPDSSVKKKMCLQTELYVPWRTVESVCAK